ncbi:MAG: flagellar motor protein MotB [Planctomycetota bacterium]|nr:flagellar motor protein MotB [Planctomycetota bacterium]
MSKKGHTEEGLPEWIMSYADMITILMAFFVVMYSMAGKKDTKKAEAVMQSFRQWLGPSNDSWPLTRIHQGKRLHTAYDSPSPVDRHKGATDNVKATVPQPDQAYPDGATVYLSTTDEQLSKEAKEHLRSALEHISGKRNLIEIRGQAKRHASLEGTPYKNTSDMVYQKCRMVMDYLIAQGIDAERLQIRIIRADVEATAAELAELRRDVQLDVFMLPQYLDAPPVIRSLFSAVHSAGK